MEKQLLNWGQSRRLRNNFLGLKGKLGLNVVKSTDGILEDIQDSGLASNRIEANGVLENIINKINQFESDKYFVIYSLSPNTTHSDGTIPTEYILRSYSYPK